MRSRIPLPSVEFLRETFGYDPKTGDLWLLSPGRWQKPGALVALSTCGHRTVMIGRKRFFQHRVIWKMVTGEEPPKIIDHVNQNGADNRWDNLRKADVVQNSWNAKPRRHNKTGYRGVTFHKGHGVWQANIKFGGARHYLGNFETAEAAAAAFDAVAVKVSQGFYAPDNLRYPGADR